MTRSGPSRSTRSLRRGCLGDPRDSELLHAIANIIVTLWNRPRSAVWRQEGKRFRLILTSFALPQSTTYRIPGIVNEVSATFVDTTTVRASRGASLNTLICLSVDNSEYRGSICIGTATRVLAIFYEACDWRLGVPSESSSISSPPPSPSSSESRASGSSGS